MRVSVGAVLSTVDAGSDLFVLSTYYREDLILQANILLTMISINIFLQIFLVLAQYRRKNWKTKLRELLISLLFLRPAVDAFRVSTNHDDSEMTFEPFSEMCFNKVRQVKLIARNAKHPITIPSIIQPNTFAYFFHTGYRTRDGEHPRMCAADLCVASKFGASWKLCVAVNCSICINDWLRQCHDCF